MQLLGQETYRQIYLVVIGPDRNKCFISICLHVEQFTRAGKKK